VVGNLLDAKREVGEGKNADALCRGMDIASGALRYRDPINSQSHSQLLSLTSGQLHHALGLCPTILIWPMANTGFVRLRSIHKLNGDDLHTEQLVFDCTLWTWVRQLLLDLY
jgi:hypothetical protein